mmetsp:Transcript_12563/g.18829  ORF Transcript_12563/g.18829 Transcript_12563/m.18829 type:complete len:85 (-) Transcript_12563:599-853(-)
MGGVERQKFAAPAAFAPLRETPIQKLPGHRRQRRKWETMMMMMMMMTTMMRMLMIVANRYEQQSLLIGVDCESQPRDLLSLQAS